MSQDQLDDKELVVHWKPGCSIQMVLHFFHDLTVRLPTRFETSSSYTLEAAEDSTIFELCASNESGERVSEIARAENSSGAILGWAIYLRRDVKRVLYDPPQRFQL